MSELASIDVTRRRATTAYRVPVPVTRPRLALVDGGAAADRMPLVREIDGEEMPDTYASDDWEAPDHFENELLEKALGTLRPEDRETMFLFAVEGFTAQEISDMTGRPRGTILSVLHRVRHKLRAELESVNVEGARR